MRRTTIILIFLALLTACNTTKKVTSSTDASSGSATDSVAGTTVSVDSTAWSSTSGSTISTSTHFGVLTDSVGKPIFDAAGRPITYIVQRDTVVNVVNVEHYTTSSIVTHDTVHVVQRDTLSFIHETQTVVKTNSNGWWGLVFRVIVLAALIVLFYLYYKRQK